MAATPSTEPFHMEGGPTAVLLSHGFTGSPASIRPWGQYLNSQGFTVTCPLLPGHGTRWQDMVDTTWEQWYGELRNVYESLAREHERVFVGGLSMGGGLALRLAEEMGDQIAGVLVVNPSVCRPQRLDVPLLLTLNKFKLFGPVTSVVKTVPGIKNDIKKPGQDELAYDEVPLRSALQLTKMQDIIRADLGRVTQPLIVFWAPEDHVVEPINTETVMRDVSSRRRTLVLLPDSYHVATLDNDAETIFTGSAEFIREHGG
jgi:carboxylesterase